MRRRLLFSYIAFTVVVVVALEVPLGLSDAHRLRSRAIAGLEAQASSTASLLVENVEHDTPAQLAALIPGYAARAGFNLAVVEASGQIVANNDELARTARAQLAGPVSSALGGTLVSGITTVPSGEVIYVAAPLSRERHETGAVLVTTPTASLNHEIGRDVVELIVVGRAVIVASARVGLVLARSLTTPLRRIERAVAGLGAGDLATRAPEDGGPAELRHLARTVNSMAERLERLIGSQHAFVADASHQLRTPLTALRLRLENLDPEAGARIRPDIDAAVNEAGRLSQIVDGLLALARAEEEAPNRVPIAVSELLVERQQAWTPLAEEKGIRLVAEASDGGRALGVPGAVEQVVDNLLANAIDASPAGGSVSMSVRANGRWVELHVADEGPGMTEDERAHAFDRFWRGRSSVSEGSGLGLAIARQLVRSCGGRIALQPRGNGQRGLDAVIRLEASRS